MKKFKPLVDDIIALPQKDIDTDVIIPAEFLTTTDRHGLGLSAFANLKKSDPNFPKIDRKILVTGRNFGCGSSREHAVWALKEAGIEVVLASSFADIFCGNAGKNQLLTIVLEESVIQDILKNKPKLGINLEAQTVEIKDSGVLYDFEISPFLKEKFLKNISDLDYLLDRKDLILEFEKAENFI